jgi:hypothetical protein
MAQVITAPSPTQHSSLINLLPPELLAENKKKTQVSLANQFSVVALVILVAVTSAALALRLLQAQKLQAVNTSVAQAEQEISGQKDKEGYVITIKDRLSSIREILKGGGKQAVFGYVLGNLTPELRVSSASVDKEGNMSLILTVTSLDALDVFLDALAQADQDPKISTVQLDSLARTKDGGYQLSLSIASK